MQESAGLAPKAAETSVFGRYKTEVLSGLTVALALVPEAVAFAFVANVEPLVGLYAAFIVGLITAVFGGRPGMISGATGALAVVMVSLVMTHGVEYLFATVVLMGIFQILAGVLRLGKFIRLVPYPVMLGFVNGLAIVIFLAQLGQFKVTVDGTKQWLDMHSLLLMGGCAMIGQSMINVTSGGRTRVAGICAALFLLSFILFASGLIEMIPLAALVGVMFMVVIGTFAWSSFRIITRIPRAYAFVLVLVSAVTVVEDLAIAVIVGVIVSALVFAWKSASHIWVKTKTLDNGSKSYELQGPLFFGSIASFHELFDPKTDPDDVVIDFAGARVWDHSGLQAIDTLAERYEQAGKKLHLRHLSQDCQKLLKRANKWMEVSVIEDPKYGIAVDYDETFAEAK